MNMNFKTLAALFALSFAMTGCAKDNTNVRDSSDGTSSPLINSSGKVEQQSPANDETSDTIEVDVPRYSDCSIMFSTGKIDVDGKGAEVKDNVVTITKAGAYTLSGSSENAKVIVNVGKQDKVTLMLSGVTLKSADGSVIDCESGDTLVLCLNENTENSLSDSADYTFPTDETEPDSAVFSRADLVITGTGSLSVTGNYKDAVKCKDGLSIQSGNINISSADDGIVGKDYVKICGGDITINAQSDGIKSTNDTDEGRGYITITDGTLNITSEKDGIQAEKELNVEGGNITIFAGGADADAEVKASSNPFDWDNKTDNSESKKGLKAKSDIRITGGEINITSADDSVHSNANVSVSGGTLTLSSCDDGIHADELLTINDGTISVVKSYEGLEGKNIEINDGEIDIKSADDGLNAAGGDNGGFFGFGEGSDEYYISISGGNITVNADGDGIDSNGTVAQSGGYVVVYGPTNSGNGAIDYEKSYAVSGGTLIALGASGMAQAPSTLSQPCLSINANVSAGSTIEVRSSDETVLSTVTPKQCQSLIFTSDKLKIGEEYGIYANGELLSTLTAEEGVTGNGANGAGFGGPGGFGHGGFGGGGFGGDFGGGFGGGNRGDGNKPGRGEPNDFGEAPDIPENFGGRPNDFI
ncbi:MAG: carbohydrate-binding domain-containing protein [Ruminococcaceae bacterium]|nr:carbohydrate-binding domain-containing protein [Oscillospiraceae bacterium]